MKKGFTLLELIIVMAIIATLGTVVVTLYGSVRQTGSAKYGSYIVLDAMKEAQIKAKMMEQDSAWGVKTTNASAIVFSGNSYALRTSSLDRVYNLPSGVVVSGLSEVVFAKFSGTPNTTGTTTLVSTAATSSVYVWQNGVLGY